MSRIPADRNLMVGMLGLQLGLYDEAKLLAAMRTWTFVRSRLIEDLLRESGDLTEQQQAFLRDTAREYLSLHAGNATECLASISLRSAVEKELHKLDDDEVGRTLHVLGTNGQAKEEFTSEPNGETTYFAQSTYTQQKRYRILREYRRGALGKVSVALDCELHREVALKEMQSKYVRDPDARKRFMLEAEITGRLEHPGIVPVYSLGLAGSGDPYYAMRFIRGESLKQAIGNLYANFDGRTNDEFSLAIRRLVKCLIDVCNAVGYAHSRGVLHRDLKPDNVMLGKYGETLVVDWGLAKTGKQPDEPSSAESVFISVSGDSNPETQMGSFFGTPEYASPEQIDGRLDILGPTSDVYSLGATLYSILTGQAPVPNVSLDEKLQRVRSGNISPPRSINASVPPPLESICIKAMSLNSGDRYCSAEAMASDLELWLAGEPVTAYAEPFLDRASRLARRHRTVFATLFGILVTGLIGLLVSNSVTRAQNRMLTLARDEARKQSAKATESLKIGRSLAFTLLNTAEERLSNPDLNKDGIWDLRNSLTEETQKEFKRIHLLNPSDSSIRSEYATVLRVASNLKRFAGDYSAAESKLQESLNLQLESPESSRSIAATVQLSETYRDLGIVAKAKGEFSAASRALDSSIDLANDLSSADRANSDYRLLIASASLEMAGLLEELDDLPEAMNAVRRCSDLLEPLRKENRLSARDLPIYLYARSRQIRLLHLLEQHQEADRLSSEVTTVSRKLLGQNPDNPNLILPYTRILYWSVDGLIEGGDLAAIDQQWLTEAIELSEQWSQSDPSGRYRRNLGEAYLVRGRLLRRLGMLEQAESSLVDAARVFEQLIVEQRTADNLDALGRTLHEQALMKRETGDTKSSLELLKRAVSLVEESLQRSPESVPTRKRLKSFLSEMPP